MRFGVHVGVGKGFSKTIEEARAAGCDCIQIFAGNPRAFKTSKYDAAAWDEFRRLRKEHDIQPVVIHTSYLINLATANTELHAKSAALLANDLVVAAKSGIEYVNTHLGSYGDQDPGKGLERVCATIKKIMAAVPPGPMLLLENSAGSGKNCGGTLEELGFILDTVGSPRVGVCIDTAHAWASGYDLHSEGGMRAFVQLLDKHVGLRRVRALHVNDTQVALGAKRDLHWHVGKGKIGNDAFRRLFAVKGLAHAAAICETPKTPALDRQNVSTVKRLAGGKRGTARAEHSRRTSGRKRT